jgi:hypothetical protein
MAILEVTNKASDFRLGGESGPNAKLAMIAAFDPDAVISRVTIPQRSMLSFCFRSAGGASVRHREFMTLVIGGARAQMLGGAAVLAVLSTPIQALDLTIGTRFPALANEEIVVKNDGGVRNATHSFAFGESCYSDRHLQTWFIVRQIVGDQVLVELECIPTVFGPSCPNGTETSRSLTETQARVNAYARDVDMQFIEQQLQRFNSR